MSEAPSNPSASRIDALLAEGQALLDAERWPEAALLFERVLLRDAECAEARGGLERARAGTSEEARRRDARMLQAREAVAGGDRGFAREILEGLLDGGGDRDMVVSLLDHLDERQGLVTVRSPSVTRPPTPATRMQDTSRIGRRAFAFGWVLLTLGFAGSVAVGWQRLVQHLVEAPAPSVRILPSATRLPQPSAGDAALARARERAERGDVRGALGALDQIAPQDAAYPYARQMRERLGGASEESR